MSDLTRAEWADLLSRYPAVVLEGQWIVNAAADSGATALTVGIADTNSDPAHTAIPLVGSSDVTNFIDARILFGPGVVSAGGGKNFGFSTTIKSVATDLSTPATTLTLNDAVPQALTPGDTFTIYRATKIEVNAPENIVQVGNTDVPTVNGIPSVPVVEEGSVSAGKPGDAPPSQAQQVAGSDGTDLRVLKTDTDGTAQADITKVNGTDVPTDFAGNPVIGTTRFDQLVQDATIASTQTGFVASGEEVAYGTLTVNGTWRVNGAAYLQALVVNLGGRVILGDQGQITTGAF